MMYNYIHSTRKREKEKDNTYRESAKAKEFRRSGEKGEGGKKEPYTRKREAGVRQHTSDG